MADKLIKVTKNGLTLMIHPLALEDHTKRLGWTVVEEVEKAPAATSPDDTKTGDDAESKSKSKKDRDS
jgi:hypothetical protein